MRDLIKILTETYGPSGREDKVRRLIIELIKPFADHISVDKLGNLIAVKGDAGEKLMLAAHMDEIGVIVTDIDKDGFLRFSNVGGVSPYQILGERMEFEDGTIGTVGMEKLDDMKELKLNKMFIDIGASSREDALKKINIGDMAVYHRQCNVLGDHIISKALDDRVGCAVLIKVLQNLKSTKYKTYFVFTVQEEVGLRGARTSSFGIDPDLAIAVDVTLTGDTPEAARMAVKLGLGPAVKIKDNSVLCHPRVKDALIQSAKAAKVPYQMEVLEYGGTDAGAIHLTKSGVPAGGLSIPTRYVHTPSEMANVNDMEGAVNILLHLIQG